jgi:uncharacterized protein
LRNTPGEVPDEAASAKWPAAIPIFRDGKSPDPLLKIVLLLSRNPAQYRKSKADAMLIRQDTRMQLDLEKADGNIIRSYSPGELHINGKVLTSHIILSADSMICEWMPTAIADMNIRDFAPVLELQPQVILFGSGETQIFPPGALVTAIMKQGIGFETMDTAAACRTFNVLACEQRRVVAALLVR